MAIKTAVCGCEQLQEMTRLRFTYFEVTDKVLLSTNGNVRWLTHVVAAVEPADEITSLRDAEYGR